MQPHYNKHALGDDLLGMKHFELVSWKVVRSVTGTL